MKKGLIVLAKDVDAYLANFLGGERSNEFTMEIIVPRHRDALEYRKKFPRISKIHDLAKYIADNHAANSKFTDEQLIARINEYAKQYQLRSINRYIHYDFFRGRQKSASHRANLVRVLSILSFFDEIEFQRFDFLMGELSRSFNLMAFDMAKSLEVRYLHPVNLGVAKGIAFVDEHFHFDKLEERKHIFESDSATRNTFIDEAKNVLEGFRNRPAYKHQFLSKRSIDWSSLLKNLVRKSENYSLERQARHIDASHRVDYVYESPMTRVWKRDIWRKINGRRIEKKYFDRQDVIPEGPFVFFPLHVHPETTTSLFSEFIVDHTSQQASSIEYISKVLPPGYTLVVKEHPAMIGARDSGFYEKVAGWYNVQLVSPKLDQFELISRSELVLTLCGTAGVEAAMLGKPAITLADNYYHFFDSVTAISCISDLEKGFVNVLESFNPDDELLISNLALLIMNIHQGIYNFLIDNSDTAISDQNLSRFGDAILSELSQTNHLPVAR